MSQNRIKYSRKIKPWLKTLRLNDRRLQIIVAGLLVVFAVVGGVVWLRAQTDRNRPQVIYQAKPTGHPDKPLSSLTIVSNTKLCNFMTTEALQKIVSQNISKLTVAASKSESKDNKVTVCSYQVSELDQPAIKSISIIKVESSNAKQAEVDFGKQSSKKSVEIKNLGDQATINIDSGQLVLRVQDTVFTINISKSDPKAKNIDKILYNIADYITK